VEKRQEKRALVKANQKVEMQNFAFENNDSVSIDSGDSYNRLTLHSQDSQNESGGDESGGEFSADNTKRRNESILKETGSGSQQRGRNISFNLKERHETHTNNRRLLSMATESLGNGEEFDREFGRAHTLDDLWNRWNVLFRDKKLDDEFKREFEV
jgi:hypothetical protein